MRAGVFCVLLSGVFGSAALGQAQDLEVAERGVEATPGEAPRDAEARSLFEAAEAAYASGHYEDALSRFRTSYELSGRKVLLFNIGAAAERLRRDEDAVAAYREYLTALPDASNRGEVEARVRILEVAIAERAAAQPAPGSGQGTRVVTWISSAIAVAFAGLATAAWFVGEGQYDDLVEECTRAGGCTDARVSGSSVQRWDRLTNASIGLAIAGAVSATIFFFVETDSEGDDVALGVSPSGLSLRGSF